MRVLNLLLAISAIIMGLRLVFVALRTAATGAVLVRSGLRFTWEPAPSLKDAWKYAFKDGLMGILFTVLGIALLM